MSSILASLPSLPSLSALSTRAADTGCLCKKGLSVDGNTNNVFRILYDNDYNDENHPSTAVLEFDLNAVKGAATAPTIAYKYGGKLLDVQTVKTTKSGPEFEMLQKMLNYAKKMYANETAVVNAIDKLALLP